MYFFMVTVMASVDSNIVSVKNGAGIPEKVPASRYSLSTCQSACGKKRGYA
jgi:hypothetical protein